MFRIFYKNFLRVKEFKKTEKLVIGFTIFYVIFFTYFSFLQRNIEFIYYSFLIMVLLNVGIYIHQKVQLPEFIVVGLSLFALMHILGGNVSVEEGRLYDAVFLFDLMRYDNIVHLAGSALGTLVLNEMFSFIVQKNQRIVLPLYYFSLFLMSLGIGVINETIELFSVVFLKAQNQVGDYINNAVDLVYNAVGALVAIIIIDMYRLYKTPKTAQK